jgi:hypothetical protein
MERVKNTVTSLRKKYTVKYIEKWKSNLKIVALSKYWICFGRFTLRTSLPTG